MAHRFSLRYFSALLFFLWLEDATLFAQCEANFTFTGAGGCNKSIGFFADSSRLSPEARYFWDSGDGESSNEGPYVLHTYEGYGSGATLFQVRLRVSDSGCKNEMEKDVILKEVPDARFRDIDTLEPFANCNGAPADTLRLTFNSLTKEDNTYYRLDWGDGQAWKGQDLPAELMHIYTKNGAFPVTLTVKGRNGCSSTVEKVYFRGWNPGVPSLEMPPLPTGDCAPVEVTFNILGTGGNAPGTNYSVLFSDGSAPLYFNHPPPSGFTHKFNASSCGFTSRSGFKDAFDVSIIASNGCGEAAGTVEPIRVSGPPVPHIKVEAPRAFCPDEVVTLRDIGSTGGFIRLGSL